MRALRDTPVLIGAAVPGEFEGAISSVRLDAGKRRGSGRLCAETGLKLPDCRVLLAARDARAVH